MSDTDRYSRQERFAGLGPDGQRRLGSASVCIVGCGALGTTQADLLARAGVGRIRILDRDFVELSNLHRQVLFTEADAEQALPKAEAAAARLRGINSGVRIEPIVADLRADNAVALLDGFDVLLDGTDNFETRYLINDLAVKSGCPWIYGGCVGAYGVLMVIHPGVTPCLRCLMEETPAPGTSPTCDTAGVIGPIVAAIAAFQVAEALKILAGASEASEAGGASRTGLLAIDLWRGTQQTIAVPRNPACPACGERRFEHLEDGAHSRTARLCGRNAVQINPTPGGVVDLERLAQRLRAEGPVTENPFLLRAEIRGLRLTVFRDGRGIIEGTEDPAVARSLYARFVGA